MRSSPNPSAAPAVRSGHRRRTLRTAVWQIGAQFGAGDLDAAGEALISLRRACYDGQE